MNLVNKTSTITVAVVAALVALAVAAHGSGALRLSPAHAAVHGTEHPAAPRSGSLASGSGNGQGSGSAGGTSSAGGSGASQASANSGGSSSSRVAPGGGAYGQYTCQQGYVWRQVVPDDYVCVTPAVRALAAYDNSQANNRVALFSLWMSDWTPPPVSGQNCSDCASF